MVSIWLKRLAHTVRTPTLCPLGLKVILYLDPISIDIFVEVSGNIPNSCYWQAGFNFMKALVPYLTYTYCWTHWSKSYLVHGPYFHHYVCLDIQKFTKSELLADYINDFVQRA